MTKALRPAAFFSLRTQFENVGDALINRELVRMSARHADVYVDLSRCPPSFRKTLGFENGQGGITVVNSPRLFRQIARSRMQGQDAYYFLSPGGYVGDRSGVSYLTGRVNTTVLQFLRSMGVHVCHVGVSYEGLSGRHVAMIKARSRLLYRHFVRDESSAEYIRARGVHVDGVMPDLAWGVYADAASATSGNPLRTSIALSFRSDQFPKQAALLTQEILALDLALPSSIGFKFVVQVVRDHRAMEATMNAVRAQGTRDVELIDCHNSIAETLGAYRNCSHVVGNRLHALLVGAISGATPLALLHATANRKIEGLFASLGLDRNCYVMAPGSGTKIAAAITAGAAQAPCGAMQFEKLKTSFDAIFS